MQGQDESADDRPAPGSHDPSTPSGSLETSSANLFEVMIAAREAQATGDPSGERLRAFYQTLMSGTLLLPVPPNHGEEARDALAAAVNDDQEVEISVMLARDADGQPVNVLFGSMAALAAWSQATATTESLRRCHGAWHSPTDWCRQRNPNCTAHVTIPGISNIRRAVLRGDRRRWWPQVWCRWRTPTMAADRSAFRLRVADWSD